MNRSATPPPLLLWDLDGTILSTQGAGMRAMRLAGVELFGDRFTFEGITTAGGMDPLLYAAAAQQAGVPRCHEHHDRFRDAYCRILPEEMRRPESAVRLHAGVKPLLETLAAHPGLTLGLLTGNYARSGIMKLELGGIDPEIFALTAFGDEAPDRPSLVPLAAQRYRRLHGCEPRMDRVLVIGDTPRDVDAAHAHGAAALGVATGPYSVPQLRDAGADLVVENFTDPSPLWKWIGEGM